MDEGPKATIKGPVCADFAAEGDGRQAEGPSTCVGGVIFRRRADFVAEGDDRRAEGPSTCVGGVIFRRRRRRNYGPYARLI